MQYWIIINDHHAGPYSAEQLLSFGINSSTLIWHEGLPDWVEASSIPELSDALSSAPQADAAEGETSTPSQDSPESIEEPDSAISSAADTVEITETVIYSNATESAPIEPSIVVVEDEEEDENYDPDPLRNGLGPECPPTYLVFAIIATFCCCTPLGIVAIVLSSMTKSAFYRGDMEKSLRYSTWAQWVIMIAIALGVIAIPFQIILFSGQL